MHRSEGLPPTAAVVAALSVAGLTEVDGGTRRRAEYSTDASLYRVPPLAVAWPRDAGEVDAALTVARRLGIGVTLRGSGTSIAGNAVGPGIVLDTSRHLTGIGEVDPAARTVRVEPGVVLADLQRAAARHRLRFGPDPSTHDRCTLGGMLGNDACGTRALGYGRTSDNVVHLEVVTGAGERLTVAANGGTIDPSASRVHAALADLVTDHGAVVRDHLGRFDRQVSGYGLHRLLPEHGGDLAAALVGSEGTCAVTIGATLRLTPLPTATRLVVLGYPDLGAAGDAVPTLRRHRPVALEGLDRRIVDAVVTRRGPTAVPALPAGGAWILAELVTDEVDPAAATAALDTAARALVADADATDHLDVPDARHAAALWAIRRDGAAWSSRSPAGDPAHAGWEDAAVPPGRVGDYLRAFDALLTDHGLTTLPYGHLGDGCVHARIDLPLGQRRGGADRGVAAFRAFLTDAADLVASFGGSLSGEHGDGRGRSELLPRLYPPAVLDAFAAFERAWDPDGVLNPGVLVRPRPVTADLRLPTVVAPAGGFTYAHDHDDLGEAVHRCIGVGSCRSDQGVAAGAVMCPSYLATGDEKDSTRGRARVLQEVVDGSLLTGGFASAELHDSLDLCLGCKGCAVDCPAGVDVATYKVEALHRTYAGRRRPRGHLTLGQLPRWARLAGVAPGLAGRALDLPGAERLARWVADVDPRRPLPRPSATPFSRAARRRPDGGRGGDDRPPVLLWVDTFSDRFDPHVAVAAVRVLEAAGHRVELPTDAGCCGLTWLATGQLDGARRRLRATAATLAPWARAGVPIVGLEPPCAGTLRDDGPRLLPHEPDVAVVAGGVRTLAEQLTTSGWTPPDLSGTRVLAQPHCHHHAVFGWGTDRALLETAGAQVEAVGGCCGLAGDWGVTRGHHDVSVAVAETALLPAVRAAAPGTVLLADGFSCRTQLDHLAGVRSHHLAELLAARLGT